MIRSTQRGLAKASHLKDSAIQIDGQAATVEQVKAVARDRISVQVSSECYRAMEASRQTLRRLVDGGRIIYGVTTGMGGMREFLVPDKVGPLMQTNLLRAVATNVGDHFPEEAVRAAMLARLNSLARGHSAIQVSSFEVLLQMLNGQVSPLVPEKGSLGASGDLGPLACIALAALGEGSVIYDGQRMDAAQALEKAGIPPMRLEYKEGLALVNGTSMTAGLASLVCYDMNTLCDSAEVVAALSVQGLQGRLGPFDERVHRQKPHPGQLKTAINMMNLTKGSKMAVSDADLQRVLGSQHSSDSTRQSDMPIMDAYSIRCIPQVHGPAREAAAWAQGLVERELNSSNDDPLVIPEHGECFHNGHFHAQYVSMAMDLVAVAANTLGQMSDRRIDRFMDKNHSSGLPPFLCDQDQGVRLGMMGGQFMTSSVVAEDRAKCTPMSIQSITSTEDFQDFVSLGLVAARRTREVVRDTAYVLAVEALCGAQAADIRGLRKLSPIGRKTYDLVRQEAPFFSSDTCMTPFIERVAERILARDFARLLPPCENGDGQ